MKSIVLLCILSGFGINETLAQTAGAPPNPVTIKGDGNYSWGSVSDGKFVSAPLGISISIPSHFTVVSTVEVELLTNAGKDLLKQGIASEKRLDEAFDKSIRLLTIAEKPIGALENSALEVVAGKQPKGVTANMSLLANVAVLKGSPFTLTRTLGHTKVGANIFAVAELEGSIGEIKLTQRMYVIMNRGYSIMFLAVYSTANQVKQLEQVLSTLVVK